MTSAPACFAPDPQGYVRHWITTGPQRSPYGGPSGTDDAMRRAAIGPHIARPPDAAALGEEGPFGQPWGFTAPGANIFVERSAFFHQLTVLDLYAATDLLADADGIVPVRLWACGTADLWLNGEHLARHDVPRYMYPDALRLDLPLRSGANRLAVRLQGLGVRDTRYLFGLQVADGGGNLAVRLPGAPETTAALAEAEAWLESVAADGRDALIASAPPPVPAEVTVADTTTPWPTGEPRFGFNPAAAFGLSVALRVAGQSLTRSFEIPANLPQPPTAAPAPDANRRHHALHIAAGKDQRVTGLLAHRLLGGKPAGEPTVANSLAGIEQRNDCADFTLAMLLRLVALDLATPAEAEQIRRVARGFRYWPDEPGTDAMCFGSENHALLFHGCQAIAGRLYPNECFTNSGRTGAEQAAIGLQRCRLWLDATEAHGFREYHSSTYMPLTMAALMNVADFSGDEALARRAAALVDRIFEQAALHAFDGVTIAPQGRVYRNVLYPHTSGTQAILSYGSPDAVVAFTDWLAFVASSPTYSPPETLGDTMRRPAATTYRENGVEVALAKTADYLLTSLAIPASFDRADPESAAAPNVRAGLFPGSRGYQQHLWHATLGRGCHVFVNHPGCTFDQSHSRPGYWYGNGILPRLAQRGNLVAEIFDIPEQHPIHFTHAHWPSDAFEHEETDEHWAIGACGTGAVALWCSQPLGRRNEVLTGRELIARGRRAAWLCLCGSLADAGGFEAFAANCRRLAPAFDPDARCLRWSGCEGIEYPA